MDTSPVKGASRRSRGESKDKEEDNPVKHQKESHFPTDLKG